VSGDTQTVDEAWGPAVSGRGRRRGPWRWVLVALLVLVVLVLLAVLWVTSRIPTVQVDGLAAPGRPMHVLVVGSDSRDGLSDEDRAQLGTGTAEGDRTDTIFVLSIRGGEAAMLAFPRDLWVERCDGSTGRINVAEAIGGPSCLVETVRDLSGLNVQHYVRVTFGGFVDVVDAVGGVELCLDEPISDRDAHIDLPAGCQVLGGTDALGFVRVRKIDDDLQRIQRQQTFLQALAREVAAPSTLFNPFRAIPLGNEVGGAVATDQGMGPISLARLAWGGRGLATGNVAAHTVPATPDRTSGGADILRVSPAEAEALFASFRDGSVFDEGGDGSTAPPQATPADVTVRVLNGTAVSGLAGRVGAQLEERGYTVAGVGNTDPRARTTVHYPDGQRPEAELVARELPDGADVEESGDVDEVTLLLGQDAGDAG
jgi:LCP family protein required for cell wall assembly